MPSPRKDGEKSPLALPMSEGQEKHDSSGTLGTLSISGNTTAPNHRIGESETLPVTDVHQDVDHMHRVPSIATHDGTTEARTTHQESLPSDSTGLWRGGSESFPHSDTHQDVDHMDHVPNIATHDGTAEARTTHQESLPSDSTGLWRGVSESFPHSDAHQDVDHMDHVPNIATHDGTVEARTTHQESLPSDSTGLGRGVSESFPHSDAHQDVDHMHRVPDIATHDGTVEARTTHQESLPSDSTGLWRGGSESFPHSDTHQDVDHMDHVPNIATHDGTAEARTTHQESLPSDSTGLWRGVSESFPHSDTHQDVDHMDHVPNIATHDGTTETRTTHQESLPSDSTGLWRGGSESFPHSDTHQDVDHMHLVPNIATHDGTTEARTTHQESLPSDSTGFWRGGSESFPHSGTHQDVDHMHHVPNIATHDGTTEARTTHQESLPSDSTGLWRGVSESFPHSDTHQDVDHMHRVPDIATHDGTVEARTTHQESLPSDSTGLGRGGSESFPHPNSGGLGPSPSVEHGPRVDVLVLGPDPRRAEKPVSERSPAVTDSEKKVFLTLTSPSASRGTSSAKQRRTNDSRSNEVEHRYQEPPSNAKYRQRSPLRTTNHRRRHSPHRRASSPSRPPRSPYHRAPSPRGGDQYRPSSHHNLHNRHGDDDRRPRDHNAGRSGRGPRSPTRAQSSSFREGTFSGRISRRRSLSPARSPPNWDRHPRTSHHHPRHHSTSREPRSRRSPSPKRSRDISRRSPSPKRSRDISRRSLSPKRSRDISRRSPSPKRSRDVSRRSPRQGAPDPRKPLGGGPPKERAHQRHNRRDSEGGRATSSAQDGSIGCKPGPKDSTQGDHASTNASKTTRGCMEGTRDDGKIGDKPRASTRPDLGPTSEPFEATIPSPKSVLLNPIKSTPTAPGTNVSPSTNTRRTSTIAPETMGNLKSFADKTPGGLPGGPTPLSGTLPDSIPQDSAAPSKAASPLLSQEIPKLPPHPDVSPEFDAEYLKDRELARKMLGVSGKEFDAEMARRTADFNADIARRIALGHPIHGKNLPGDNSKIGESSRDADKMDTTSDDFTSPKASTQVGSDHATQPGLEGLIPQTPEPKVDAIWNSNETPENYNPYDEFVFTEDNRWPGADELDKLDSFTSFSPRWRSNSPSFVAGAPLYHIPKGFFGSSPEPFIPASPPPFGPKKPARKPKSVDRGTSPDLAINCAACSPPLTISLTGSQAALYNVHLKDSDDTSHLLFTNVPKNYYLLHVLTFPSKISRLIHSDKIITLRDFTKVIRLGFNLHRPISQITVYLYGRDSDGCPLEWKPIHIMSVTDWDGSMSVGRQWSCQISVVVEFVEPDADTAVSAAAGSGPESRAGGAGPSR
ncbi:hypothetical protein B9Z19DRAFT_1108701 [Tuber borchii]|uniref:Uncharacterized protein n=1 Tax=Tuber borchii TaxID=42251 RepID=A0A2T6ZQF1_TUBBO|nr:hypothetical protein B9Z19DRAFT_1108701 [Tuber borchii]